MENVSPDGQLMPIKHEGRLWSTAKESMPSLFKMLTNNRGEAGVPAAEPEAPAEPGDPSLHNPEPLAPGNVGESSAYPEPSEPTPKAVENWYDSLPEDYKANPSIQKFKKPEDMAKSYLELSGLLGNEKIALPKDADDVVAIAHLNKALGVPETADKYELSQTEAPAGMEAMSFGDEGFKELAFKHKLTPSQAEGMKNDYVEILGTIHEGQIKAYTEAVEASKSELNKEWGLAYPAKVKLAQDVMNKFAGSKEAFDSINAKLGTDPVALKMLAKIGEQFSEGSLGDLGDPTTGFTKTPAEAKREYDTIMSDPNDVYWSGVRNQNRVSETIRKERVSHVESLLKMQQPGR